MTFQLLIRNIYCNHLHISGIAAVVLVQGGVSAGWC